MPGPLPSPRLRWWTLTLAAGAALIADLAFAHLVTGLAAGAGMLGILWYSGGGLRKLLALRGGPQGKRGLIRVEAGVTLALLGVMLARLWILWRQITAEDLGGLDLAAAARTYTGVYVILTVATLTVLADTDRFASRLLRLSERPALMLAGSFAILIAVGTTLLALPTSVHRLQDVSFVDSLFTITSAVCVTGLTVNDLPGTYTDFGLMVILLSVQLGGLGIMTLAALALTASREAGLEQQSMYCAMMDTRHPGELRSMMRTIVGTTLAIELAGALLLWAAWDGDPRMTGRSALWLATFHSISAFCNAGFGLFPGNLAPFTTSPYTQIVFMVLIVLGGIGFPVMRELWRQTRVRAERVIDPRRRHPPRLSLQSRVVLATTALLIVGGAWLIGMFEHSRTLEALGLVDEIVNTLFASVTTRTAGFNTIDFGAMRDTTLLVVMGLMFIGGSPGSTAGGIKTTTAATLFATLRAELRGREPELAGRALPLDTVRRAVAVTALSFGIVVTLTLALTLTEDQPFIKLVFEAVSAFATAGLSTGITPSLSVPGKLLIAMGMFVGRVGPLTIALAIGAANARRKHRLAPENLPIG